MTDITVYDLATEIAKNLPDCRATKSNHEPPYNEQFAYLIFKDGLSISVSRQTYGASKGRLNLSGDYPRGPENEYIANSIYIDGQRVEPPSITVNPMRGPATVARDISNRLLPAAREHLQKVIELKASREAYANEVNDAAS